MCCGQHQRAKKVPGELPTRAKVAEIVQRFLTIIFLLVLAYYWFVLLPPSEPKWKDLTESQWRQRLSPAQFEVLRESATEDAYSGKLLKENREGQYLCAACRSPLFHSSAKFDSGTGWPSFDQPSAKDAVSHHRHNTVLAVAVEVKCANCDGHLGHIFPDGPTSTGNRYCMNSLALNFEPKVE